MEWVEIKLQFQKSLEKPLQEKKVSSFLDKIKEYLPLILAGAGIIGAYLLNKNGDKQKLPSHLEKLESVFKQLDQKDKESLGKILMDVAEKHTKVDNEKNTPAPPSQKATEKWSRN